MPRELRIIGSDPGERNYGFTSMIATKRNKLVTNIEEIGMFERTITNLTHKPQKPPKSRRKKYPDMEPPLQDSVPIFMAFWSKTIKKFKPDIFIMERFQSRGSFGGSSAETISIMNALIASICIKNGVEVRMITAATWKNQVNKFLDLKELYTKVDLTAHSVDSSFIALYGAVQLFDIEWSEVSFNAHVRELRDFEQ